MMLDIAYAARSDVTIERESLTIISELPRQPMSIVRFRQFAVGRDFIILQLQQRSSTTSTTSLPSHPNPISRKFRLSAMCEATIRKFRIGRSEGSHQVMLSIDYNKDAPTTKRFFATVQNKLHYAVHGHTAAELTTSRGRPTSPIWA